MIILSEFARSASEIRARLYDKTPITVEHIAYLCIDPNNINRNHWMSEIYSFINNVGILKSSKKFPSKKFIYDSSYGDSRDVFTNEKFMTKFINAIIKKENFSTDLTVFDIMTIVDNKCVEYFQWLAEVLSETGFVDIAEVIEEINTIIPAH